MDSMHDFVDNAVLLAVVIGTHRECLAVDVRASPQFLGGAALAAHGAQLADFMRYQVHAAIPTVAAHA